MIIEFALFLLMHHDCFNFVHSGYISFYVIWTDMFENNSGCHCHCHYTIRVIVVVMEYFT